VNDQVNPAGHFKRVALIGLRPDRRLDRARRAGQGLAGRSSPPRARRRPAPASPSSALSTMWWRPMRRPCGTPISSSLHSRRACGPVAQEIGRFQSGRGDPDVGLVKARRRDIGPFIRRACISCRRIRSPARAFGAGFRLSGTVHQPLGHLTPPEGTDPGRWKKTPRILGRAGARSRS